MKKTCQDCALEVEFVRDMEFAADERTPLLRLRCPECGAKHTPTQVNFLAALDNLLDAMNRGQTLALVAAAEARKLIENCPECNNKLIRNGNLFKCDRCGLVRDLEEQEVYDKQSASDEDISTFTSEEHDRQRGSGCGGPCCFNVEGAIKRALQKWGIYTEPDTK
jgi:Zn finger protein HypA/HybF involved in hydrogenase expression